MNSTTTADRLLDSMLDFLEHAPDAEFLAFLADTGRDREALSQVVGSAISSALKTHGKHKRVAAKAQFAESIASYERRRAELPKTVAEKMGLFARLLMDNAAAGMRTSLAHRDLSSVPEEELDSLLIQLIELTTSKR
jgi:ABC-type branched-subunit amino acid transport system ATPase component